MKRAAYRAETLSPFDLQGTEEHLSAMAAQGWRLESIGRFFWKYRPAEPAAVHYAVTAPPAAGEDGDLGDRLFFEELCAAAGWEKVTDWAALQIYANGAENPVPLETDEPLRLETIHQSMRRTYLRDRRNQLLCYGGLLLLTLGQVFRFPRAHFLSALGLALPLFCLLSLLGEAYAIAGYFRWLRRSRRRVEEGGVPAPVSRHYRVLSRLSGILMVLLFLAQLGTLVPLSRPSGWTALVAVLSAVCVVVFWLLDGALKRRGASREIRAAAGLLLVVLCLLPAGFEGFRPFEFLDEAGAPPSYVWNGENWDLEPQPLPLTVEELTGEDWPHVRRRTVSQGRTPFASETSYSEAASREDGTYAYLSCAVLDAPNAWVCRRILEDMLKPSQFFLFRPEEPGPWGAEEVYRRFYRSGEPCSEWIVFWPGRIVTLYAEELELTPERQAVAGAGLAPEEEPS